MYATARTGSEHGNISGAKLVKFLLFAQPIMGLERAMIGEIFTMN
jgi:hypothetical protein